MKKTKITWVLFLMTFTTISFSGTSALMAQPGVSISFQTFYNELSPYGRWVDDRDDGRIWIPDVERDFRPYATRGHWVVTDYGNTWMSDYDWGWAPFHYGRWRMHDRYGWVWVPGTEWGPAWVSWRSGGGYYGWAPLGPRVGISINIDLPLNFWVFIPQRHLCSPYVYNYYEPRPRIVNIYQHTTIINNIYRNNNRSYVYGPDRRDIERVTHSRVQVYKVNDSGRPGSATVRNGAVNIYRPEVSNRNSRPDYSRNDDRDRNNSSPDNVNRGRSNDNGNSRNSDNRGRPGYAGSDRTASERITADAPRSGNDNSSPRVSREPDRTAAAERNTPSSGRYTPRSEDRRPEQSSQREMPQRSERSQGREAPQQQRAGREDRTQSRPEQSSSKNTRGDDSGRRERPSRAR